MEKHTINIRDFAGKTELNFNLGIGEDFANNLYQSSLFNDDKMINRLLSTFLKWPNSSCNILS